MAIYYTGSASAVANIKQTPGAITDTFANRPAATAVTQYTLFFASDTGAIYQSTGASWVQMGGGGGGSQTLQQVLTTGSTLTANNTIDNSGWAYVLQNLSTGNYYRQIQINDTGVFLYSINASNLYGASFQLNDNGFKCFATSNNFFGIFANDQQFPVIQIGNLGNRTAEETPFIDIDATNKYINIGCGYSGGVINCLTFLGDTNTSVYAKLGDDTNVITGTYINIDISGGRINTEYQGVPKGIDLDFSAETYIFGDTTGFDDKIQIDHAAHTIDIYTYNQLTLTYDDRLYFNQNPTSANAITQTTHGGASGQYLKVQVDGVNYVIELRNP